jgi:alpha/beta superfamily hydrolase
MMDSHIYKKASNRLPHLAGIEIIRFNTRGTKSDQGQSEGEYGFGESERFDVEAAIDFSFEHLDVKNLWVMGWSFGTEIALKWARDLRVKGLILLSPPFRMAKESDLEFWANDGRTITALVPEFDDYLKPAEAKAIFGKYTNINEIDVEGGKHLWVGEPQVHLVLSEITKVVAPKALPLPTEI